VAIDERGSFVVRAAWLSPGVSVVAYEVPREGTVTEVLEDTDAAGTCAGLVEWRRAKIDRVRDTE
jgi:hypothetical protein